MHAALGQLDSVNRDIIYDAWGTALQVQAKEKTGTAAAALFEMRYEKDGKAVSSKPEDDRALYRQACIWAIKNDEERSIAKLKQMKDLDADLADKINADTDFEFPMIHPFFKEFLAFHRRK